MNQSQNTIRIAGMTPIYWNMHLWSGGGSLKPADIGLTEKDVPKGLINLGRIVAVKAKDLNWFTSKRRNLTDYCDKVGVRYAGGWLIHDDQLDKAKKKFEEAKLEFEEKKKELLLALPELVQQCIEEGEEAKAGLGEAVRSVAKRPDELDTIMQFNFSQLENQEEQVGLSLLENVAQHAMKMSNSLFNSNRLNPNKVSSSTFTGLRVICEKMDSMSYLHPAIQPAVDRTKKVLSQVDLKGDEKSKELTRDELFDLEMLLNWLSDPEQVKAYSGRKQGNITVDNDEDDGSTTPSKSSITDDLAAAFVAATPTPVKAGGSFDPDVEYNIGDQVSYNGETYLAIAASKGEDPTLEISWELSQGEQAQPSGIEIDAVMSADEYADSAPKSGVWAEITSDEKAEAANAPEADEDDEDDLEYSAVF